MSLRRVQYLTMHGILPFNFGMGYEDWVRFYEKHPNLRDLCPDDPKLWTQERREQVDKNGKDERDLYDRLMLLSDDEFYIELNRLRGTI